MSKNELILCIVNEGFSENVMNAARKSGANGGTVIKARGTAKEEVEKSFNISICPDKEIVLLLVDNKIKDDVLHSLYKDIGLDSPGQGIAFSIPVDEVIGLSNKKI